MLPVDATSEVPDRVSGVYVLFDSSETARYVGMSKDCKVRVNQHLADSTTKEVVRFFSVFALKKRHQARELESMLIHSFGPALFLNIRKQRQFGEKPSLTDYEPGTLFLERRRE
jgi:excinuclease UvrABC nuclease subunit